MKPDRFTVRLENFHEDEAKCNCGCGKNTSPTLMLKVQALIYKIEGKSSHPVRCLITGPARCKRKNISVYNGKYRRSYHMGYKKEDQGSLFPGAAVDIVMQYYDGYQWNDFSKEFIAKQALDMGLFGGVGWKIYGGGENFVHLDEGPIRTF